MFKSLMAQDLMLTAVVGKISKAAFLLELVP